MVDKTNLERLIIGQIAETEICSFIEFINRHFLNSNDRELLLQFKTKEISHKYKLDIETGITLVEFYRYRSDKMLTDELTYAKSVLQNPRHNISAQQLKKIMYGDISNRYDVKYDNTLDMLMKYGCK